MPSFRSAAQGFLLTLVAAGLLPSLVHAAATAPAQPVVGAPHAALPCRACHTLGPSDPTVSCTASACHQLVAAYFLSSNHDDRYRMRDPRHPTTTCPGCHGGHKVVTGETLRRRLRSPAFVRGCLVCHATQLTPAADQGFEARADTQADGHESQSRDGPRASCFDCHGNHSVFGASEPGSPISRTTIGATCGGCHPQEAEAHGVSVHGVAVATGDALAPTCVSCHRSHGMCRPTAQTAVETCASCHDKPEVLRRTGLTNAPLGNFRATFHGLAYAHGITDVATCVSCHRAHAIYPKSDPRSSVSPAKLAATCSNCHPQATPAMLRVLQDGGTGSRLRLALRSLSVLFPIAATRLNVVLVVVAGVATGFASALFGIGGGLVMMPLLLLLGTPAAVAVACGAAQVAATSLAASLEHHRRRNVDTRLGLLLASGGIAGALAAVGLVHRLRAVGVFDLLLHTAFAVVLAVLGVNMVRRALRSLRGDRPTPPRRTAAVANLAERLPLQISYPHSGISGSALVPLAVGGVGGVCAALLGVAGGFVVLPVLVHTMRVQTRIAVGTTLCGVAVTSTSVALLHAGINHSVDPLLAAILFLSVTLGARLGLVATRRLRRDRARIFLAVVILALGCLLIIGLLRTPPTSLLVGVPS